MHFFGALHPEGPARLGGTLDLRALSLMEGVRAGLAASLPVLLATLWHLPVLNYAALGALMTCIGDPAGPIQRRVPALLGFVVAGGLAMGGFGLLRAHGMAAVLAAAAPALFACAFLRVWGAPGQALGNLLAVVVLLGADTPHDLAGAAAKGGAFMAGGVWALLLTLVIWRIYPFTPARRAVAGVWAGLADYARSLQRLAAGNAARDEWEAQTRLRRGAVRGAIEQARQVLLDTIESRGPAGAPAAQHLLRLETADQVFAGLIGLEAILEVSAAPVRASAAPLLRRLRPLLSLLVAATEADRLDRFERFARAAVALAKPAGLDASLLPSAVFLSEQLQLATKFVDPAQYVPGAQADGTAGVPWRARVLGPLTANLTWGSVTCRHAARVTAAVTPALAATLVWHGPYTHWLTITMVLVMQPFFALTWERSLSRTAGTLLGGIVAAGLSLLAHSKVQLAAMLPVLGALALAVRQVSYGAYIAVYTPTVILLVENLAPGQSPWHIAVSRAGCTVLGGVLALAGNMLLWPDWEPDVLRETLRAALRAHAAFAAAVLGADGTGADAARRAAGLACNNLEASLARALQEPARGQREAVQAALAADAALRRIGGRLTAMAVHGTGGAAWVVAALTAMAEGRPVPPRGAASGNELVDRLARQVAALPDMLVRAGVLN
jgi:uncharacterized membrane protein YccC